MLGVFLTAAYMVVKGRYFMKALKMWKNAAYKLLQSTRLPIQGSLIGLAELKVVTIFTF